MNADGTTAGYDIEMTAAVSEAVKIPVVASGGAGSPKHILDVLTTGKADAMKLFSSGKLKISAVEIFRLEGKAELSVLL